MAENNIPTHPQRIRVFLKGGILAEGDAHVKAGAYRQRVSDLLNLQSAPFLALTNVNYQAPGSSPMHTDAFLVRIPDIVAVDLFGTSDDGTAVPEDERYQGASGTTDAGTTPPPPSDYIAN